MVDVIQEENTEDFLALSGVSSADGSDTVWDSVRARAPWLGVNLFTAFIVSAIISLFEHSIEQIVALAVLMPVVAALGGQCGQSGTCRGGARDCRARIGWQRRPTRCLA